MNHINTIHAIISPNTIINAAPDTLSTATENIINKMTIKANIINNIILIPPLFSHNTECLFREQCVTRHNLVCFLLLYQTT